MSDNINEVRERLERACIAGMDAEYVDDVSALLADHARLQDENYRLLLLSVAVSKLNERGFFAPSTCADAETNSAMADVAAAAKAVQP